MLSIVSKINKILGISESYQAPDTLLNILYNREHREKVFKEMLSEFNYDVSYSRHGVKGVFFVQNDFDDFLKFSSLNLLPYSEEVSKEFGILSWAKDKDRHKPIKDTTKFPEYLIERIKGEEEEAVKSKD